MQSNHNLKFICNLFMLMTIVVFAGCSKNGEEYLPGIKPGTRFASIHLNGYILGTTMQVRVGPRSSLAGYVSEEVSGAAFEVPFDAGLDVNRVVFYTEDGSKPYTGSQIRFNTPAADTTVKIFYDGKDFFQNPVFPTPAAGKMGLRITFKSPSSTHKGAVDIEIHEAYEQTFTRIRLDPVTNQPVINPSTGKPYRDPYDSTLVKTEATKLISNIKSTEFSEYVELPEPVTPRQVGYAFYAYLPGTKNPLTYANGVVVKPWDFLEFKPDHTSLYTIEATRITNVKPNKIEYRVLDITDYFQ